MHVRDYPNLCQALGPGKADVISFHCAEEYVPGSNRVRVVINPHRHRLMWDQLGDKPAVDDILSGIARLDYGSNDGLNPVRLHTIMKSAERISSELLADVLAVTDRQARRYLAAVRLAIFHLNRHYHQNTGESCDA